MKGDQVIVSFILTAIVTVVAEGDLAQEDPPIFVCPEDGSYCIPRNLCPFRMVSYDFAVQMRVDSSKVQLESACGRLSPTESFVCCMGWDKMVQHEWEPSETSWFLKKMDADIPEPATFPLWPGYKGDSARQQRRIGESKNEIFGQVHLEADQKTGGPDSETTTSKDTIGHIEAKQIINDTLETGLDSGLQQADPEDDGEWVILHQTDPEPEERWIIVHEVPDQFTAFINPSWPFMSPFFRHFTPPMPFMKQVPSWRQFLNPQQPHFYQPSLLDILLNDPLVGMGSHHTQQTLSVDNGMPLADSVEDPLQPKMLNEILNPALVPETSGQGEEAMTPRQVVISTSHVRIGGKGVSRTRIEEDGAAREEVVFL